MNKEDKLSKLLEIADRGLTNNQIASLLQVKSATVSSYKRILKSRGFFVEGKSGRPVKSYPQGNTCI